MPELPVTTRQVVVTLLDIKDLQDECERILNRSTSLHSEQQAAFNALEALEYTERRERLALMIAAHGQDCPCKPRK